MTFTPRSRPVSVWGYKPVTTAEDGVCFRCLLARDRLRPADDEASA